jgi:hypothetical protein
MPLPAPRTDRELIHTRTITCAAYGRADGLYDIDGWMTDVKTYTFVNHDRGQIPPGEPLHGMGLRLTIDEGYTIHEAVAVTDYAPMNKCANVTPNFEKLVGLKLAAGFKRAAREVLGGTAGCTHLLDLLGPMATTAFQTIYGKKLGQPRVKTGRPPALLNSCYGWATDGAMVKREYPEFYTGPDASTPPQEP